ncbi:MAG TPA: nuclear transport factor 2 family protein [Cyclobacteriaceae bacterium]
MDNLKQNITMLNSMILQGRVMEAFDRFYHEDVTMQENDAPPMVGKAANRKREEEFHSSIVDFRREEVLDIAIGENVTMVEWAYDYTHKDWGNKKYTQVSVQHWADGKIIREQFFYGS